MRDQGRFVIGRVGWLAILAACCMASSAVRADPPAPHMANLTLVVPAAVGGGWDLTAKAMKTALEHDHRVDHVSIVRYPGAGGLIGLSQFVAQHRGNGEVLLVGGLVMMGAALRDEAAVTLRDVTPVARLTGEWDVISVPVASPFADMAQVRAQMVREPGSVRWVGGALGGPDQSLVTMLAARFGTRLDDVEYYGRAGGRRVTESLLGGRGDLGVSDYAEFAPYVAGHALRVLAVAAPHRLAGVDAPTLREMGIDATMMNWRAVFAAPGVSAAQQDRLTALMASLARSPAWAAQLRAERWTNTYLDGSAFSQFLEREQTRLADAVRPPRRDPDYSFVGIAAATPVRDAVLAFALVLVSVAALWSALRLRQRRRAMAALQRRMQDLVAQQDVPAVTPAALVRTVIDDDFGEWKLSTAEADIAWFMLRGLPMREIATLRGTSERTVRQQAQAIYRKAGLDGRSDLAGRVLERFI